MNELPVTRLTNDLPTPAPSRSGSPVPSHAFSNIPKYFDANINYASPTKTEMPVTSTPKRQVHEPWNTRSFATPRGSLLCEVHGVYATIASSYLSPAIFLLPEGVF